MQLHWRRFVIGLVLSLILAVSGLVAANVVLDPYGIFHAEGEFDVGNATNERFRKMAYLQTHPLSYDSFLLGSSKVGGLDPLMANRLFPGHRFYNLGVFSGLPRDSQQMLKAWKAAGGELKMVVLGLDEFTLIPPETATSLGFKHFPETDFLSRSSFYFRYLFDGNLKLLLNKLVELNSDVPSIRFDFTRGTYELPRYEAEIARDPERYFAKKMAWHGQWVDKRQPSAAMAREFHELLDWLNYQQVRVVLYIQPINPVAAEHLSPDLIAAVRHLASSTGLPFADFTRPPHVFSGVEDFYEFKHFRPRVGERLLNRLADATFLSTSSPEGLPTSGIIGPDVHGRATP